MTQYLKISDDLLRLRVYQKPQNLTMQLSFFFSHYSILILSSFYPDVRTLRKITMPN